MYYIAQISLQKTLFAVKVFESHDTEHINPINHDLFRSHLILLLLQQRHRCGCTRFA